MDDAMYNVIGNKKNGTNLHIFFLLSGAMVNHEHQKLKCVNMSFLINRENLTPQTLRVLQYTLVMKIHGLLRTLFSWPELRIKYISLS